MNRKIPVEVYSRVCGYYRPVLQWNPGKREEFTERKGYILKQKPCPAPEPALERSR